MRACARPLTEALSPPALIGGESSQKCLVDWFSCTWAPSAADPSSDPVQVFRYLVDFLAAPVFGEPCTMHRYESGLALSVHGEGRKVVRVGSILWGGPLNGYRARLELSGKGCALVRNWGSIRGLLEPLPDVQLTRVDLAADFLNGEVTPELAVSWYRDGGFNAGGRNPDHSLAGDWLDPLSPRGRTLYIGRRANGKQLRCYEKGKQLGDPLSPWVRLEVELRNNDRVLPWDVVLRPDAFFVGAYRVLSSVVHAAAERIQCDKKGGEISISVAVENAAVACGPLLHVLRVGGLTASEVCDLVARPGVPSRLESVVATGRLFAQVIDLIRGDQPAFLRSDNGSISSLISAARADASGFVFRAN